jgi:hypothetical protein
VYEVDQGVLCYPEYIAENYRQSTDLLIAFFAS